MVIFFFHFHDFDLLLINSLCTHPLCGFDYMVIFFYDSDSFVSFLTISLCKHPLFFLFMVKIEKNNKTWKSHIYMHYAYNKVIYI